MKIYWANFFSRAKNAQKGRYTGDGTGPAPEHGGPAGPVGVVAAVRPGFPPECSFSTSFFGHKILREV
jgi:hypothetical protein